MLVLVALLGFAAAVGQPAEFALVPAAAGETELARANGRMESVRALGFSAGPLLGGVLGAAGQLRLALAIDARVVPGRRGRGVSRCGPAAGRSRRRAHPSA